MKLDEIGPLCLTLSRLSQVDFSYVFANAGFSDNVTIYMCIILSLTLYLFLTIWARYADRRGERRANLHLQLAISRACDMNVRRMNVRVR